LKTELYDTPVVFDMLADEWDNPLDPQRADVFFMRHDWQRIWWRYLGRGDLAIITFRDDVQSLRGITPWFITEEHGRHVWQILGCIDVSDYLDLILMPGYEKEVIASFLDFVQRDEAPAWDEIRICNILEGSPTLEILPLLAAERGLRTEIGVEDVCPIIQLPTSYEDYLDSLDKKQRHELRRKRRRAEDYPVKWHKVVPGQTPDDEIEAFLSLMSMSTSQKADFLKQPGYRDFFAEMGRILLGKELLEINFLSVGGQRAAALWNFAYRDRLMLYNSGLNPLDYSGVSAGIVLLTFSIEDAIRRGFRLFDFLRGNEEYKYRMGARSTSIYRLAIYPQ
jgi:CelD/BcsL family acetyltransferase involved in cellulose biosynthesis